MLKGKCTLKSQEWMYFVWYKRVVCIKCKNVIKVEKTQQKLSCFQTASLRGVGLGRKRFKPCVSTYRAQFAKGWIPTGAEPAKQ